MKENNLGRGIGTCGIWLGLATIAYALSFGVQGEPLAYTYSYLTDKGWLPQHLVEE